MATRQSLASQRFHNLRRMSNRYASEATPIKNKVLTNVRNGRKWNPAHVGFGIFRFCGALAELWTNRSCIFFLVQSDPGIQPGITKVGKQIDDLIKERAEDDDRTDHGH